MPLFNESLESIAKAFVIVTRAVDKGVVEEKDYNELDKYLVGRTCDFFITDVHLDKAARELDDELKTEVEEFFMDEDEALYKMAEDILCDFTCDQAAEALTADEKAECDAWLDEVREQVKVEMAQKAWAKMDDEERAAMAAVASAWQKA